jgi:hypothetical protein
MVVATGFSSWSRPIVTAKNRWATMASRVDDEGLRELNRNRLRFGVYIANRRGVLV